MPSAPPTPAASPGPRRWARAVFWGLVAVFLGAKLLRSVWLALDGAEFSYLAMFPLAVLADLWVAALVASGIGLISSRWAPRAVRGVLYAVGGVLTVSIAVLQGANLMSYRISGGGLTWLRLRGDEGADVTDLSLVGTGDLILGFSLMAGCVAVLAGMAWFASRPHRTHWPHPAVWIAALVAGVFLWPSLQRLPDPYALFDQPVLLIAEGLYDDEPEGPVVALGSEDWEKLFQVELSKNDPVPSAPPLSMVRPQNAVIYLAEGIPWTQTSLGAPDADPTPNLRKRLAREGVVFDRYYANYHSSIQALFSIGCAQYPPSPTRKNPKIGNINPRVDCGELSEHFRASGVAAGLFHGGHFAFYDKLSFFGGRAYLALEDAEVMEARGDKRPNGKKWFSNKWGIDDRAMVDAALAFIDRLEKGQRFVLFMVPIAPHYPYKTAKDIETPFDRKGTREEKFRHAVHFQDQVFERLLVGLEERGVADDTAVLWLADHGELIHKPPRRLAGVRQVYEDNLHVPLVILNSRLFGDLEPEARTISRVGSHVDILPTVSHLLGVPPDPRHLGQALMAVDFVPRRVFFASNRRKGKYQTGFIDGDFKLIHVAPNGWTELYNVREDPGETIELASEYPDEVARGAKVAKMFRKGMLGVGKWPRLPDARGVASLTAGLRYGMVSDEGTIDCVLGDQRPVCAGDDGAAHVRLAQKKVKKAKRDCILLRPPGEDEALEIRLTGESLGTISSVRVAVPSDVESPKKKKTAFSITVDGKGIRKGKVGGKGKKSTVKLLSIPAPQRELRVRVKGGAKVHEELCIVLSDAAWWAPLGFD